jgi:hypothetical protein
MCVVSNITDWGRKTWPYEFYPQVYPQPAPYVPPQTGTNITPAPSIEQWNEFLELVEKAKKFDEMVGEKDCIDPGKEAWMKRMEARMQALEDNASDELLAASQEILEDAA